MSTPVAPTADPQVDVQADAQADVQADVQADAKVEGRRQYELVYILQPELTEREIEALNQRVTDAIFDNSGTGVSTELWGQRTLAYEIRDHWKGYYVVHNFEIDAEGPAMIDRLLRFNEDVLRYKVMRTD